MISVVAPVLNESEAIGPFLEQFASLQGDFEILVVDGGSTDGTVAIAEGRCGQECRPVRVLRSAPGRAGQMNAGAGAARGDILLFLHVDTFLPEKAFAMIETALAAPDVLGGRFKVRMSGESRMLRLVERGINWRDGATGGFTGDQGIFVRRTAFESIDGFPELPLCEDVEFARRLKRAGRLVSLWPPVTTSSRRYERCGPVRTAARMWAIKGLFLAGIPAERLAAFYPDVR